jgi:hypothetical protein
MSKSFQRCQEIVKKESCQKSEKRKYWQHQPKSSVSKTATISTPQKNVTFCYSFYYIKRAEEFSAFLDHMRQSRIW